MAALGQYAGDSVQKPKATGERCALDSSCKGYMDRAKRLSVQKINQYIFKAHTPCAHKHQLHVSQTWLLDRRCQHARWCCV
jgi:hypothetical protein